MRTTSPDISGACPIDLSVPDNRKLIRGRSLFVEAAWYFVAAPVFASRFALFSSLRVWLLRFFGAKIGQGVYIKPGVKVKFPWYLTVGNHCWIGEDAWIDNLAEVSVGSHVCISQAAYLCTGNHDWSAPNMPLFSQPIQLETGCWVGARSVVGPGVRIGEGAVLTAGAVASKALEPYGIYAGNPAVLVRRRVVRTT